MTLINKIIQFLFGSKQNSMLDLDKIPTPLPRGKQEFEIWAKGLIDDYGFPDNASVRFMFAAMIMHLKSTEDQVPREYFAKSGWAAAAKEVAMDVMKDLKNEQEAKAKAEAELKTISLVSNTAEATVDSSSSGQEQ